MARRGGSRALANLLTVVALAAPAALLAAAAAVRLTSLTPADVQTPSLSLAIWVLSWISAAAAVVGLVLAARDPRVRIQALVAVVAAGLAVWLVVQHRAVAAEHSPPDVTSNVEDPPALAGAGAPLACEGLAPVMSQVRLEVVAASLEATGLPVERASNFRADGARESFWLGVQYRATVRIRPGRTDVRVAALTPTADGGGACRLARRLVAEMAAAN